MQRSLKFTLESGNRDKLKELDELWVEYQKTITDFLNRLFEKKDLSEKFIKEYQSSLSYRYKQCAKRQAFKLFKCWCRNKKKGNKPSIKTPSIVLDYRFIELQKGSNSFNYWVKIATLNKGKPVLIPLKSYNYANNYFQNWDLVKGGRLVKNEKGWFLILTFEKEIPKIKTNGDAIGIDIGIKKLIVDSNGNFYGKNIESLMNKIQRRQQGSKAFKRALKERDDYINKTVKELPFNNLNLIVAEDIKDIKRNTKKEKRLGKEFRSKFQRWTYSKLINRIGQLSEISGVHYQLIPPAYTSQTCNACGFVHKGNRNGEIFRCRNCDYTLDADLNASRNILKTYFA